MSTTTNFTPRVGKRVNISLHSWNCEVEITVIYGGYIEMRKVVNGSVSLNPLDCLMLRTGDFYKSIN